MLDGLNPTAYDDGTPEYMVAQFDNAASFTIRRDLTIGAVNPPATGALGLASGAALSLCRSKLRIARRWPNRSRVFSIQTATIRCCFAPASRATRD